MDKLVSITEDEGIKFAGTHNTRVLKQLKYLIDNSEKYNCYSFTGHPSRPKWLSFVKEGQYTFFFDNAIYSLSQTRKLHQPSFCKLINRTLYLPFEMSKTDVKQGIIDNINEKINSGEIVSTINDVVILEYRDPILAVKEVDELPYLLTATIHFKECNINEVNEEDYVWAKQHFKKREAGLNNYCKQFDSIGAGRFVNIRSKEAYLPNNAVYFKIKRVQGFYSNGLIFVSKKSDKIYIGSNQPERSRKFKGNYYFTNKPELEKQISEKLRSLLYKVRSNSAPYEYPETKAEFLKLMSKAYDLRCDYKKEFYDKFGYLFQNFEEQLLEQIREIEDDIEVI
jgi:hypothetical protein